jgi:hypothetical protein
MTEKEFEMRAKHSMPKPTAAPNVAGGRGLHHGFLDKAINSTISGGGSFVAIGVVWLDNPLSIDPFFDDRTCIAWVH